MPLPDDGKKMTCEHYVGKSQKQGRFVGFLYFLYCFLSKNIWVEQKKLAQPGSEKERFRIFWRKNTIMSPMRFHLRLYRRASIKWWRSSKPIGKQAEFWKWGQVSRKIFGYLYFMLPLAGRWARFAAITGPLFPDYIPQRMRGMAMDSGLLRPVPTRRLKIDAFLFLWCIGKHYAL